MAQGVRSRLAVGAAVLLAGACGGSAPGNGNDTTPRAVDTAALAAEELVAVVLAECHAPLLHTMDRVTAVVVLADGSEWQLFAQLPDRLRAQGPAGGFVLRGANVLPVDGDGAPPPPSTSDQLFALRALLDAAAFGPLHRATGCTRTGPASFVLAQPAGPPIEVELRPGTLLPARFRGPGHEVIVHDYLRTSTTWIVRTAELPPLGRCTLRLRLPDMDWAPDFFAPRSGAVPPDRPRLTLPGAGREPRPATPALVDGRPSRWIVVPDPGGWPARVAAYQPLHDELTRQDQQIAGFPYFWQQEGRRWLGVAFRRRAGGPEFEPPVGWRLRDVPAARWLEVFPPDGDLEARIAAGERLLQEALRAGGHEAAGPIAAQPYFHLDEGPPPAHKLLDPVVRLSVPLR